MNIKLEKFYTPFYIVSISVIISLLIFFTVHSIKPIVDFYNELIKSIIIPIGVSLPITLFTTRYHKKIYSQKKELEKLNELNNKLISIIAHDIRSPISVVQGFVEILHEDVDNNSTEIIHDRLETISNKIDNLLIFLNDLLKWSKNQIYLSPINMTAFDTKVELDKIILSFEEIQLKKNISITTNIEVTEFISDKEIYSFMIRNLYHNALKFTKKGGNIHLELIEKDQQIHTIIKDNGVGITEANLSKIRDEKQWFSSIGTCNESGTGLGIKTILQYLKIFNGQLIIDSKVNSGTTMNIILPKTNN